MRIVTRLRAKREPGGTIAAGRSTPTDRRSMVSDRGARRAAWNTGRTSPGGRGVRTVAAMTTSRDRPAAGRTSASMASRIAPRTGAGAAEVLRTVTEVLRTVTAVMPSTVCREAGSGVRIVRPHAATIPPRVVRTRRVDSPAAITRHSVLRARATSVLAETTSAARGVMIGDRVTMTAPGVTTAAQSVLHRAEIARTAPDVPRCRSAVIATKHADRPVTFRRA